MSKIGQLQTGSVYSLFNEVFQVIKTLCHFLARNFSISRFWEELQMPLSTLKSCLTTIFARGDLNILGETIYLTTN